MISEAVRLPLSAITDHLIGNGI